MPTEMTSSGLPVLGDLPWGSHICHFYDQPEDLSDLLAPFFRAGLERGEQCLWVADRPLRPDDARTALGRIVPDLERRMRDGQIAFVDAESWYRPDERFDPKRVIAGWLERMREALALGFRGLRVSANTFWLEAPADYRGFAQYEAELNGRLRGHPIICVCSYCAGKARANDVIDVVRNHDFAVLRRDGAWEIVENASLKLAKQELAKANALLESRVRERTRDLERALAELRHSLAEKDVLLREVHHRVKNNLQVINSLLLLKSRSFEEERLRQAFDDVLTRVSAMGLVHETLYQQEDTSGIDFARYLRSLAEGMIAAMGAEGRIRLEVEGQGRPLDLNTAVPAGLIAAEVLSNALKHAFPGDRRGRLAIALGTEGKGHEGLTRLTIEDDGIGFDPGHGPGNGHVGLRLLNALVRQIGGEARFDSGAGTTFSLRFAG